MPLPTTLIHCQQPSDALWRNWMTRSPNRAGTRYSTRVNLIDGELTFRGGSRKILTYYVPNQKWHSIYTDNPKFLAEYRLFYNLKFNKYVIITSSKYCLFYETSRLSQSEEQSFYKCLRQFLNITEKSNTLPLIMLSNWNAQVQVATYSIRRINSMLWVCMMAWRFKNWNKREDISCCLVLLGYLCTGCDGLDM